MEETVMRFPYGLCDFNKIITKGYFYCDRTDRIAVLEDTGDYLLLLRPRRFGKSLLLSMLENYYDVERKDRFQELFGWGVQNATKPFPVFGFNFFCSLLSSHCEH